MMVVSNNSSFCSVCQVNEGYFLSHGVCQNLGLIVFEFVKEICVCYLVSRITGATFDAVLVQSVILQIILLVSLFLVDFHTATFFVTVLKVG
jgi:hypothetical protein